MTQFVCRYRTLRYSRQEGTEPGLEEEPLGRWQAWGEGRLAAGHFAGSCLESLRFPLKLLLYWAWVSSLAPSLLVPQQ